MNEEMTMLYEEMMRLMEEKHFSQLRELLVDTKPVDIAEAMEEMSEEAPESTIIIFRLLPKDLAAEVFSYLSTSEQLSIVDALHEKQLKNIVEELNFDDKIDFLEEMPANVVKRILKNVTEEERKLINQFLNYPEYSAGSLMTIEYIDLKKEMTVSEALQHIRTTGVDKETIYTCYVLNETRRLEGIVSLRKLVLAEAHMLIEDLMDEDLINTSTWDDQEEVADLFKKYDLMTLPVVDQEGRLVGIITIDDIVDVIEQENTEDFEKMAALLPGDEEYLDASILTMAKKRLPWLLILMISATFTGSIISRFEDVLQAVVVLAAAIPMLMDTAGNAGNQSSTLVIRGIALGEIELEDYLQVLWKEFRISLLVGLMLGLINFARMLLIVESSILVAVTVSFTLSLTVVMAKIFGGLMPIIAKKMKVDPAIMAGPLITTIVDAMALIVYFNMASLILGIH
ncbi:magnesium transporter [Anoxynatronum buryatiense]|uniref:Magnesium transporter MgtE n=1 Tax=Anoxynatronum buryatiense TaxID=489973 RepID=A0AA45WTA6_9CLOT|nr:magnesium transporter [Anoxynatronum buryatiense]SMP41316.1 magnesium transporter [Anoxynatronum buryatiense]